MKINRYMVGLGVLAGLAGLCASAQATVYVSKDQKNGLPPIQSSEDAVSRVPVLGKIPHSFLVGDGFKIKLSGTELRIDHMADHSRPPLTHRNCMISLNVASPIAFFGSSMELPLMNAQTVSSGWSTSSRGDYVLHFSKDATVAAPPLGLRVSARF